MGSDVLIDSYVYIDLLRVRKDPVATLYQWGEAHGRDLAICGMIRVEVGDHDIAHVAAVVAEALYLCGGGLLLT